MHHTAFVPYSVTAGCSLTKNTHDVSCAMLSDHGFFLIQAFFQALQQLLYSWGIFSSATTVTLLLGLCCDRTAFDTYPEDSLQMA